MKKGPEYIYDFSKLPEMISVETAANAMGMSESFIRKACNNGDIEFFQYDKSIRISRQSFLDFISRHTQKRSKAS